MSKLCGGKESVIKDAYWLIRHLLRKNRDRCPRCGYSAFRHGYEPHDELYCTKCHLWEPNWEEIEHDWNMLHSNIKNWIEESNGKKE